MAVPGAEWKEGQFYIGGVVAGAALDRVVGHVHRHRRASPATGPGRSNSEACYAGTSTTKGNLVFVGRNNGELEAYDAHHGDRLWNFQTGAGANNTASFFEHDGKQYVAFLAQGNSLQATPHGDEALALRARRHDRPGSGSGSGCRHRARWRRRRQGGGGGHAAAGETVFAANFLARHGALGRGGNGPRPVERHRSPP